MTQKPKRRKTNNVEKSLMCIVRNEDRYKGDSNIF